jgi:beta-glucuronidase
MRSPARSLIAAAAVVALALPAEPAAAQGVTAPSARTLYENGPSGRHLLDGAWLYRPDPLGRGLRAGWMRSRGTAGWLPVAVPHAWNATDGSIASYEGTVGWYRRDFRLPSPARAATWIARFEAVNNRARVWLNGRPVGSHAGAHEPFELRLPGRALRRGGVNRLVLRVDSRRRSGDFPPAARSQRGTPTGGWWNYGGILREVYLRRVNGVDLERATVLARPRCPGCAAVVDLRVTVRNYGARKRRVRVVGRFGARAIRVGRAVVAPGGAARLRRRIVVRRPRLWSPADPHLYEAPLVLRSGGRVLQRYALRTGIRSVRVAGGRLQLNGAPVSLRGVALHEDSPDRGAAVDNAWRDATLAAVRELGATIIRSHYPLHPYLQEQADRLGILQWSEIPVFQVRKDVLARRDVRDRAVAALRANVAEHASHPSIAIWSIGNELSSRVGSQQGAYVRRAAIAAKAIDPTRPVGIAVAGYPSAGCQRRYGPLEVIGLNTYFGWYPGPGGELADRTRLGRYLDRVRACYPNKALMVTEFGAEANRAGPVEEKGSWAFQEDFIAYHLGVYATRPWLSGAIYWTLQEFRVSPEWEGGNPRPAPPVHQKAVIDFAGNRKPGWAVLQRLFRETSQLGSPR